jgi:hypothetical protein
MSYTVPISIHDLSHFAKDNPCLSLGHRQASLGSRLVVDSGSCADNDRRPIKSFVTVSFVFAFLTVIREEPALT